MSTYYRQRLELRQNIHCHLPKLASMVVTIFGEADVTVSLIFQILLLCGCCHSSLGAAPSRACSSQLLRVSSGAGRGVSSRDGSWPPPASGKHHNTTTTPGSQFIMKIVWVFLPSVATRCTLPTFHHAIMPSLKNSGRFIDLIKSRRPSA